MLTSEVLSLSIHYLISIWSRCWWNLNKIVWSAPYKIFCFLTENRYNFLTVLTPFWKTFLWLKQLFDAKILIQRLSSFSVPKLRHSDTCNRVKSCTKHGRPDQYQRKLTVALNVNYYHLYFKHLLKDFIPIETNWTITQTTFGGRCDCQLNIL